LRPQSLRIADEGGFTELHFEVKLAIFDEPVGCIRRGWEANSGPVGKGDGAENGRSVKQSLYPVYAP
jgi:hypothetical protein